MSHSTELRRQIEDLALRLAVGEQESGTEASGWMPALERIRDSAVREHAGHVAAVVDSVLDAIRGTGGPHAVLADLVVVAMHDGMGRIQDALDHSAQGQVAAEQSLAEDPELMADFVVESREHLLNIEAQVLTLERDPLDSEALNSVFRGFHTIKGLAGFLELWEVQKLAHEVETVLDRARNSEWTITAEGIEVILQSADFLRRWLEHLESLPDKSSPDKSFADKSLPDKYGSQALLRADELLLRIQALSATPAPMQLVNELSAMAAVVESGAPDERASFPTASIPTSRWNDAAVVKVDTAKLDSLADMAGEMVIAGSLVRHDPDLAALKSPTLQRKVAHLTRITEELQKTAMAMRMVPIGPLFRRMARLVRDLSHQFGKHVDLETEGDDIQLDRTIVEELADPLMHMVRNALDHGIESPAERQQNGKSAAARLFLKAHHLGGQVVIEIADDGRGLDREKIEARAVQKGLIAPGERLPDSEMFNLIFEPGFTTTEQVTSVSGRGVGMDIVRRDIEKLRGRIEIRSKPGRGATFLLKLPLTLAMIDGLVVGVGEERYIIPLFAVRELFRPTQETIWTVKQRAEMALVRGGLLPVLRLYRLFGVKPRSEDPLESVLVVAEVEGQQFCILIDTLIGKQEVVIKSLGEAFAKVAGIAGGAILGDGRVGLILDLDKLFKEKTVDSIR